MNIDFKLSEWMPDLGQYNTNALATANNVIAYGDGYIPIKKTEAFTDAVPEPVTGAMSFILDDGSITTFCGTESALYKLNGTTWDDVSKGGGYASGGNRWRFIQWGNTVYATNYADAVQKFALKTDSQFSDMAATAPKCKDLAIVGEFLVLVNTNDSIDGVRENRIWWSPIGNPEGTWAVSSTTLSDFQDLVDGSFCVGIAGGDYGVVLMEGALIKMTFVGAPAVFQIQTIERVRGCIGIGAFTQKGRNVFFRAKDGFYMFNGAQSVNIGVNKVNRFFGSNASSAAYDLDDVGSINCIYDSTSDCAIWAYQSKEVTGGKLDRWILYSTSTDKWSSADFADDNTTPTFIVETYNQSYNLDQLDSLWAQIDDIPISLDNDFFKGGSLSVKLFGDDDKLYILTGENKEGILETSAIELSQGSRSFVNRLRIESDSLEHTMNISGTYHINEVANYSINETLISARGSYSLRKDGRYHQFRISTKGDDWTSVKSMQIDFRKSGRL